MASSAILRLLVDDMLRMVSNATQQEEVDECEAKRFGRYFPSRMSFQANWSSGVDDDESTWEYSAPMRPSRSSSGSTSSTSTCYTAPSSPAQEIAARYRARMSLDFSDTRSRSSTTVCSESEDDSGSCLSWDATTAASSSLASGAEISPVSDDDIPYYKKELRAIFRQSRYEALQHTWHEASALWKLNGREREALECPRSGCGNIVPSVQAMAYHLHIHDLSDIQGTRQAGSTMKCECCSNSSTNLVYGTCQLTNKQKSTASNPLWANLRRAVAKISFRPLAAST